VNAGDGGEVIDSVETPPGEEGLNLPAAEIGQIAGEDLQFRGDAAHAGLQGDGVIEPQHLPALVEKMLGEVTASEPGYAGNQGANGVLLSIVEPPVSGRAKPLLLYKKTSSCQHCPAGRPS
jgi:hypothetical protein